MNKKWRSLLEDDGLGVGFELLQIVGGEGPSNANDIVNMAAIAVVGAQEQER